jgi:hypothetical protein
VFQDELHCVLRNIFRRCKVCVEAGGQHFETVLWNKESSTTGGKLDLKFLVDAGLVCSKAPTTAVRLRDVITGVHCRNEQIVDLTVTLFFFFVCRYTCLTFPIL